MATAKATILKEAKSLRARMEHMLDIPAGSKTLDEMLKMVEAGKVRRQGTGRPAFKFLMTKDGESFVVEGLREVASRAQVNFSKGHLSNLINTNSLVNGWKVEAQQ